MLYVFCCRRGQCLKQNNKSWLALRVQLPSENPFFEPSLDDVDDLDEPPCEDLDSPKYIYREEHSMPLCDVCGQPGSKRCGNCRVTRYCSPAHQQLHWKAGQHAAKCAEMLQKGTTAHNTRWTDESNPVLFAEFEIITEEEEDVKEVRNARVVEAQKDLLDKYYAEMEEEKKSGQEDTTEFKEEDMPNNRQDQVFVKFQTTIDIDTTQVLRYTTATNAQPLWMHSHGILDLKDVPKCALCGAERVYELQILPQIIYHLDLKRNNPSGNPDDEIDFGTLVVYTCKNSCTISPNVTNKYSSGAYAVEYLYQQKIQ